MKTNILLLITGLAALSSCSTAYQSGQTPDDLYYAPSKESSQYVNVPNDKPGKYSPDRPTASQQEDMDTYRNDRLLRMSVGDPYRMSDYDDYYWNDWRSPGLSMGFGYGMGLGYTSFGFADPWSSPWMSPIYWNSFYNPYSYNYSPYAYNPFGYYGFSHIGLNTGYGYSSGYGYGSGYGLPSKTTTGTGHARSSVFNPAAYNNRTTNSANARTYYNPRTGTYSNYNNVNNSRTTPSGSATRRNPGTYYNTNQNAGRSSANPSNSSSRPERAYTPSSSGSSPSYGGGNSGGSGGGSRGVVRPSRN